MTLWEFDFTDVGDFPAAFVRFWLCLGVWVIIYERRHPQDKPFVERLNDGSPMAG